MPFRTLILSAAACATLAAPAAVAGPAEARKYQSLGGTCSVEARVSLSEDGRLSEPTRGSPTAPG